MLGSDVTDILDTITETLQADSKLYPEPFYTESDGVDWAPALRRLVEECHTSGKSPALRARGRYMVGSTVVDPYGLQWIAESGCLVINAATNSPALQLGTTGDRTYKGSISGTISFASSVAGVDGQCGLKVLNTGHNDFGRILVIHYAPYLPLYHGIIFEDVAQFTFNAEVDGCLSHGVVFDKTIDPRCSSGRSDYNGGPAGSIWRQKAPVSPV